MELFCLVFIVFIYGTLHILFLLSVGVMLTFDRELIEGFTT